ncbi:thioredoxin fold domain-containing protein [Vibrio sp. Y2-5]|uniref:thioredoxin fold domain-containing protein n=1 Tax=Vibrio sp. Y2-5 TaxID=2743977 RepID=UPI001660C512|nr:thioredoxin fold domain-containing protein [Vibrio sp. Y2-5]MBD0788027.1 thioredoxin fold domain-containing protein [Vibrio sp. Y2-5]
MKLNKRIHTIKALSLTSLLLFGAISAPTNAASTLDIKQPSQDQIINVNAALTKIGIKVASKYVTSMSNEVGFQTLVSNAGLMQVNYEKGIVMYGNNILKIDENGDLVSSNSRVTREFLDKLEYKILAKAPNEKYRIQVFTDITCPHCQDFHKRLPTLLNEGISVEFILFARYGDKRPEFLSMSAIQGQKDPLQALTNEMNGIIPTEGTGKPSLQMVLHQQAAIGIGVTGTPAIYYKGINIPITLPEAMPKLLETFEEAYRDDKYAVERIN